MFTRLQRVIDDAVSNGRIVGIVYLVARDGKVVFAAEKGFADREAGKPVRRDTIFRLASVTKPFVATAALAMKDKGLIRLDDPVTRYLPYFTPKLADGPAPAITLRHLITHTSGLSYDYGPDPDFSDGLRTAISVSRRISPVSRNVRSNSRRVRNGNIRWRSMCWAPCLPRSKAQVSTTSSNTT